MKSTFRKDSNFIFGIIAVVILLVFVVLTVTGEDGLLRMFQLKKIMISLEHQNKNLLEDNLTYRQEIKSLYTQDAIEARAKESLGWVYPDEVIYVEGQ